jgi:pyruvate carboxylase
MWGGATFDVSMRFLKEDPWVRLRKLRKLVPNIPFQMLIRGANAVGYTSYPDNTVKEFCKEAVREGIDIFRVFDSLNYIENLKFGIEAAREAGGVVEATICYTGDIFKSEKYSLEYYLDLARQLEKEGIHVLAIKDMAGLLKPEAAKLLVGSLRKEFPNLPIHVHTHDTAGTAAASMLAAIEAGADIVDGAIDCLSNSTSQPAIGTLAALLGNNNGIIHDEELYRKVDDYWAATRKMYAPFETGTMASATDVYAHEMPGGQVTNLRFQAEAVGLGEQWDDVKKAYAMANRALGDIIKVTPSSKVVGDLALFMVSNKLNDTTLVEQADKLDFPDSVLDFMNGRIGVPAGGFPEELRTKVLKGKAPSVKDGSRPGIGMAPFNFEEQKELMIQRLSKPYVPFKKLGGRIDTTCYVCYNDLISNALYPEVHRDFMTHLSKYSDTSYIPTPHFFSKMEVGELITFNDMTGTEINLKLVAIGAMNDDGLRRVFFEVNGL